MFTRFDTNKSTKGASKLRRDLINAEIANLRDLLPLPPSTRQRLSQLQLMALVCVYVRKANYFQQAFKRHELSMHPTASPTPNIGFSKALSGFLMMMTQNGKLLYISDNAAEYLGHSMEDLLIHGDSVYDIIDKQDHQSIQAELGRTSTASSASGTSQPDDSRIFLCRMNVSRNARRQMRFGDQKVVLVQGHYLSFLPLCSRNEPVFLATCTPIAMPETRECVVQGATNVFTSIHSMDMKFMHIDKNGEFHLGYPRSELQAVSWYRLLHWDCMRDAQTKHRLITQSEQDRSCILLVRLQRRPGDWLWVHCVLQVKENMENSQQPVIVCTNQVLSEREATVMRANSWLYHYYMVQSKLQYGLAYDGHASSRMVAYYQAPPPPAPPQPQHATPLAAAVPAFVQHHDAAVAAAAAAAAAAGYVQHSPAPSPHHHHQQHHLANGSPSLQHHHQHHHQQQQQHQQQHHHHHQQQQQHQQQQHHLHQQQQQQHHHHHHHQQQQQQQQQHRNHEGQQHGSPRLEAEPVDYSVHNCQQQAPQLGPHHPAPPPPATSCSSSSPEPTSGGRSPPFGRRRSRFVHGLSPLELGPLKISDSPRSSPSSDLIVDLDRGASTGADGGGAVSGITSSSGVLLMPTALQHALGRQRVANKVTATSADSADPADPADFMEQWNPSPPWSDTLQKVPDITHQDLSPYVTTTPPTPTGTPGAPHSGSGSAHTAFTFDWVPEQFVPNLARHATCGSAVDDEHFHLLTPAWSAGPTTDHRVFPLQPVPASRASAAPTTTTITRPAQTAPSAPNDQSLPTNAARPDLDTTSTG